MMNHVLRDCQEFTKAYVNDVATHGRSVRSAKKPTYYIMLTMLSPPHVHGSGYSSVDQKVG